MANYPDLVAELITGDPDQIVNDDKVLTEWFWRGLDAYFTDPTDKQLAQLLDRDYVKRLASAYRLDWNGATQKAMQDLKAEFANFQRSYRLTDAEALTAFKHYKTQRRMP